MYLGQASHALPPGRIFTAHFTVRFNDIRWLWVKTCGLGTQISTDRMTHFYTFLYMFWSIIPSFVGEIPTPSIQICCSNLKFCWFKSHFAQRLGSPNSANPRFRLAAQWWISPGRQKTHRTSSNFSTWDLLMEIHGKNLLKMLIYSGFTHWNMVCSKLGTDLKHHKNPCLWLVRQLLLLQVFPAGAMWEPLEIMGLGGSHPLLNSCSFACNSWVPADSWPQGGTLWLFPMTCGRKDGTHIFKVLVGSLPGWKPVVLMVILDL